MLGVSNSGVLVAPVSSEVTTMKLLILRDTVCGHVPVFAGNAIEASESDARILIMANKAVESTGDAESAPKVRTRKKDESGE